VYEFDLCTEKPGGPPAVEVVTAEEYEKLEAHIRHMQTISTQQVEKIRALETMLTGYRHSMKIVGRHLVDAQTRVRDLEQQLTRRDERDTQP
jgi:hypothetical protein